MLPSDRFQIAREKVLHRGSELLEQSAHHHPVNVQRGVGGTRFEVTLAAQIGKVLDKVLRPFGPLVVHLEGGPEATPVPLDEDSGQAEVIAVVPDLELFQLREQLVHVDAFVAVVAQGGANLLLALHEERVDLGLHGGAERLGGLGTGFRRWCGCGGTDQVDHGRWRRWNLESW
uniref:(northern house mosquito) hypothetical protein n=1 Tax=Culex pipiens TaxID=7175 RepID=A0A8D8GZY2_CULPI